VCKNDCRWHRTSGSHLGEKPLLTPSPLHFGRFCLIGFGARGSSRLARVGLFEPDCLRRRLPFPNSWSKTGDPAPRVTAEAWAGGRSSPTSRVCRSLKRPCYPRQAWVAPPWRRRQSASRAAVGLYIPSLSPEPTRAAARHSPDPSRSAFIGTAPVARSCF
jgi:hypothetical protein